LPGLSWWGATAGLPSSERPERISQRSQAQGQRSLGLLTRATLLLLSLAPHTLQAETATNGDAYLAEVLAAMERRPNVSAKLRHQSRIDADTLLGSGNFWQLGAGPQRLTRWEMQTQVADKAASYVQVFDGRYLWTDRTVPSGRQIHRLDVGNLKARLRTNPKALNESSNWEDLVRGAEFRGGLSQMLADLLRRYHFAPPRATQLNGFAVEALIGQWQPNQFAELCPILGEEQNWPEQLPHHVLVLVGQSNLFPYVIEFRRSTDAELAENLSGLKPTHDPLVRYEIFEVRFADAIDGTVFQFKPGDVDWSDETSLVFDQLNKQKGAAEAELAVRKASEQK